MANWEKCNVYRWTSPSQKNGKFCPKEVSNMSDSQLHSNEITLTLSFSQNGREIHQVMVQRGDPPTTVKEPLPTPVEAGIYVETVPSDSGKSNEWMQIELIKCNGHPLSTNRDTYIYGEPALMIIERDDSPEEKQRKFDANKKARAEAVSCRISSIIEKLPKRDPHPQGKMCGECTMFSSVRGKQELHEISHVYQNGSFSMTEEIVKLMCDKHGAPNMADDNVGHCPMVQGLVSRTTPACEEFKTSIGKADE